MVEGVILSVGERGVGHAEDLTQHISYSAELVVLNGHAGLQLGDHHTHILIHWLQRLQFQLALRGRERERRERRQREERERRGRDNSLMKGLEGQRLI